MERRSFLWRSSDYIAPVKSLVLRYLKSLPALDGVMAEEELPEDEASATDYSIGQHIIYAAFAWSKTSSAYETVFNAAERHGVGFFNVSSSEEEVWLPENGRLLLAHKKQSISLKDKLMRLFTH